MRQVSHFAQFGKLFHVFPVFLGKRHFTRDALRHYVGTSHPGVLKLRTGKDILPLFCISQNNHTRSFLIPWLITGDLPVLIYFSPDLKLLKNGVFTLSVGNISVLPKSEVLIQNYLLKKLIN